MKNRSWLAVWLGFVAAFVVALAPSVAKAADKGMQFIGLSRASAQDVSFVADAIVNQGGDMQVSLLPFEYNPADPFANATALVQSALPRLNGQLRVTVYGKWFIHLPERSTDTWEGNHAQSRFWNAWADSSPDSNQRAIRRAYMDRVRAFDTWVLTIRTWANQNGVGDRLRITFVPVLEDRCPSTRSAGYDRLIQRVKDDQDAVGSGRTSFRRSCLPEFTFRVSGASLELHGPWSDVKDSLQRGDTWSNDGTDYTNSDFRRDQRAARRAGVNVLLWNGTYNGVQALRGDWATRTVNPFTNASRQTANRPHPTKGEIEQQRLVGIWAN